MNLLQHKKKYEESLFISNFRNNDIVTMIQKNLYKLLVVTFLAFASCGFTSTKKFDNPEKDKLLLDLISYVLEKGHYNPQQMDDAFSEKIYNNFLKALDPLKRNFTQQDIDDFSVFKTQIDDQIKNKDLTFFDLVYSRFIERSQETKDYYKTILDKSFNFTVEEYIDVDYDALEWTNSKEELKERWRKQLKFTTLSNYYDLVEEKKNAPEKKRKATEAGETYIESENAKLSLEELEAKARKSSLTALNDYFEFADDLERKDYFSVFLNALVETYDPHTNYLAPSDRDRFDLRMSGKLEGIGARLQKKNDYITIVEIISGGPVWRGEHLEVGDAILKVKQEDEAEPVSIVGMRVDDAVKLIKGPKGTKVTLTIKRVDGAIEEEVITRDVVELEETYAKSSLIEKNDKKFGLINLPAFYFDMKDYGERNAATDVKKEIEALKQNGMEGLILDLRDNGGGSLRTAVDIAGLFIKNGPVVQVASGGNQKEVLEDENDEVAWDGPLVILVNELSASASEILAAAMQDYKRGIVIGSKQSYGKGTVQNLVDLNQWLRQNDLGDMGSLKLTTQKFYRVNGGSTQLEGVKSDVVMPDRYSYIDIGERDYDNPLPYDKISPAKYNLWEGYIDYEGTINRSKERMAVNQQLLLIDENAKYIKKSRDQNRVALNFEAYSKDIETRKEETKKFEAIDKYDNKLSYTSLPDEVALMKQDTTLKEKRKRWHQNLAKDIYVEEAVNVLEDLKLNNIRNTKVAKVKN